ncbi:MAG: hypothetical protein Tsb0034_25650 [Ekhidna sp.]
MRTLIIAIFALLFTACSVNKQTVSMHPFAGKQIGCGNFIVYKLTESEDEFVSVAFNAASVELSTHQAYAIGKAEVVEVKRKKYAAPIAATLCNDVMEEKPDELQEEVATEGVVEVLLSDVELQKAKKSQEYRATVILKRVTFESVTIDYLRIENVFVGWLPG